MNYSKLPEEIKQLKQWVCVWNGSKVPMSAYERVAASSADSSTWSDFNQAAFAVQEGYYDNVGFVFADNGIVGIDIDAGFEDGLMTPLCADIMKLCHSYTEVSRSGRGVHILVRGDIPFHGKNNFAGVEIYKAKRFFIMTGHKLIYPDIVENQEGINEVIRKYFPENLKESSSNKSSLVERIYAPIYEKPKDGKIFLKPVYPKIESGGRNLSLTSLAGSMHNIGYSPKEIFEELQIANREACVPPLPLREVQAIVESITRYKR